MVQTYTPETPLGQYRQDFLHRGAICGAVGRRKPELLPIGQQADETVLAIDGRRTELQRIEDALTRARALERAAKLGVTEQYELIRKLFEAYQAGDLFRFLPDPPSVLARAGIKTFGERVEVALVHLRTLPEETPLRVQFVPQLEQQFTEFQTVDRAEDQLQHTRQGLRLALTTYKAELSTLREEQLGRIQTVVRDREQLELFTLPWRKTKKSTAGAGAEEPTVGEGGGED